MQFLHWSEQPCPCRALPLPLGGPSAAAQAGPSVTVAPQPEHVCDWCSCSRRAGILMTRYSRPGVASRAAQLCGQLTMRGEGEEALVDGTATQLPMFVKLQGR